MDLAYQRARKKRSGHRSAGASLQFFLNIDVCDSQSLFPGDGGVGVEVLSKRPLDIGWPGVLALDPVRIVRVHGPQLRAQRDGDWGDAVAGKSKASIDHLGGQIMQGTEGSFLREKRLKDTQVGHRTETLLDR